jgi:hypothetical protein
MLMHSENRPSSSLPKSALKYTAARRGVLTTRFSLNELRLCLGLAKSKSDLDAIDAIVATGKALQTLEGHSDRVSVERPNGEGTIDA